MKIKKIYLISVLTLCFLFSNCAKAEDSSEFTVGPYTSKALMEPGPCQNKSVNSSCTLSDGGRGTCLELNSMWKSYGYNTGCVLAGEESGYQNNTTPQENTAVGGTTYYYDNAGCNDACGNKTCEYDGDSGQFYCSSNTAVYDTCNSCSTYQTCQVDDTTGKYFCVDNSATSNASGLTKVDTCGQCSGTQTCNNYDGDYYCSDNTGGTGGTGGTGSGAGAAYSNNPNLDCSSGVCFPTSTNLPDPAGGIAGIITNVLYWLLGIFGVLAIIAFIISGIQYILSAGSEETIDTAKKSMKWSIVGVIVALSGLVVIYAIDSMLRGISTNF